MKKQANPDSKAEVSNELSVTPKYEKIKLGIDWHAKHYRVVRIIDGAGPQPAQRFTPEKFLTWTDKQLKLAAELDTVYEAGAGGFVLHRQLQALGANNVVIAPRKRKKTKNKVKTDKLDARELAMDLDRFVRGNPKALAPVYVPTPEEEQRRHQSRQREQLREHRLRLASQGRSLLLNQGWRESNYWWRSTKWSALSSQLPQWMLESLEITRRLLLELDKELKALTKRIEQAAPTYRPMGLGALSFEQIQREVCNWQRFKNRKNPGSYSGLVGGVAASGESCQDLSVTKAGNKRVRVMLVEAAWRFVYYQSQSPLIQRWANVLLNPAAHKRARKKAIIAVARQLFVDLWRWQTGRTSPEKLGWIMLGTPQEQAGAQN